MVIDAAAAAESIRLDNCWSAEIYRQWDFPPEVIDWWQATSERQGDIGLFTSPGWLEQCWLAWGTPLLIMVIRERGCLRGIFPCHIAKTDRGDRAICSLTVDVNQYDFLTDGDPGPVVAAFARLIANHFSAYHVQLDFLSRSSADLIERCFRERGFPTWTYSEPFAPYIAVDGNWQDYLLSLSSSLRKDLRRRRRLAEQDGQLVCEVHRGPEDLQDVLSEALDIEARSWKGRAGTAVRQNQTLNRFTRLVTEWAARERKLYFLVLRHEGKMIAFQVNFVNGATVFGCKMSFDEEAARYSPGQLALYELLERQFLDPAIQKLSFLGQCHGWKERWTKETELYHWVTIFPRNIPGRCRYFWRHGWKEPFKQSQTVRRVIERMRSFRRTK
jgi:CelD/BcsL family acetyltransferase involved in cellulose biosynthesis